MVSHIIYICVEECSYGNNFLSVKMVLGLLSADRLHPRSKLRGIRRADNKSHRPRARHRGIHRASHRSDSLVLHVILDNSNYRLFFTRSISPCPSARRHLYRARGGRRVMDLGLCPSGPSLEFPYSSRYSGTVAICAWHQRIVYSRQ